MKYIPLVLLFILLSCKGQNTTPQPQFKHTNALVDETSPYLLQHAHNPVNWNAWNAKTLARAKAENKLLLISVGYSACHWCHVMEHESFEDSLVAQTMNSNFIPVKVDREERPDVDQVYMNAVQLMTGSGGWPLNVVALPDGRPIWGGTYFPKKQWTSVLEQIAKLYKDNPDKLIQQADHVERGLQSTSIIKPNTNTLAFNKETIADAVKQWSKQFDSKFGGLNGAPKFMMPNNYHFLLRYAHQTNDKSLLEYVNLTLTKMAYGGVYDHVGGGFSRYSVDEKWHVPHFEKMLYDNAQLVSLYADAFLLTKNKLFKEVVEETLNFIKTDMTTEEGAFYASFDADSKTSNGDLEEGAFYVWQKAFLKDALKADFELFSAYYNINNFGLWEDENYVLIRKDSDSAILKQFNITQSTLDAKKVSWKAALLNIRNARPKPRLDDKILTSWNGLMLKAYLDAYRVFNNKQYLDAALKNAEFISSKLLQENNSLNHTYKAGQSKINAYMDDYAIVIEAFITLYETTLNDAWLYKAKQLADYTFNYFLDKDSTLFFYTSSEDAALVSRNKVYYDNVIPSSNSIMAKNLFKLAHYFDDKTFETTASQMLHTIQKDITNYPSSYSNWLDLMLNYTNPYYEVAIVGSSAKDKLYNFKQHYVPNALIVGSTTEHEDMPLLARRFNPDKTLIYVCVNKACKLPVTTAEAAIKLIEQ